MKLSKQVAYGQVFTPREIADFMVSLIGVPRDSEILDPAVGKGVFFDALKDAGFSHLSGYEIDRTLTDDIKVFSNSFVSKHITQKFDVIIGNPPYVRWRNLAQELQQELQHHQLWQKYCNNLCDYLFIFILKSITLLKEKGELLFITPEYWMTTTHAQKMRDFMLDNGYITDIIHLNESPIFPKISSATIIFKFIRDTSGKKPKVHITKYLLRKKITIEILQMREKPELFETFDIDQFTHGSQWYLAKDVHTRAIKSFESACDSTLGDIAKIGNGMVSGLDKAFQITNVDELNKNEREALLPVIKAKDLEQFYGKQMTYYAFLQQVKTENELEKTYPHFYKHFQPYKELLLKRYNYHRIIPYWDFVFPRNFSLFHTPLPRIFVPCKERISHRDCVRFAYVPSGIFPTQDITAILLKENIKEDIYYILALLNSSQVFRWIKERGVIRGGVAEFSQAPLASIPIKRINWSDAKEATLHDEIVSLVKEIVEKKVSDKKQVLQQLIDTLVSSE